MMIPEEDILFATAESDDRNSARVRRGRRRVADILKDRSKKKARLKKKGRSEFDPWLEEESLEELRKQLREIDDSHHRKSRSDRAHQNSKRALKPVPMKYLQPGAIVDTWIPFVDRDDYKRRPAVVISADQWSVDVFPLTSSLRHRRMKVPMHILEEWEASGLSRPTGMQQRRVTIARADVLDVSGELKGSDRAKFFQWRNAGRASAVAKTLYLARPHQEARAA